MIVYGAEASYFTGKFEAYLRYKGIAYERRSMRIREYLWTIPRAVGSAQLPTVQLPDGRWMTDTTPMIAWLEGEHPEHAVLPEDPVARFVALLIEDYGDEWLWRPAMHYRWNNAADRELISRSLATEIINLPMPLSVRRRWIATRQHRMFVAGDGVVDERTRAAMDATYLRSLDLLEPILAARDFLLGERPTVADLGLFGSMFRHFSLDPTPGRIMRDRAPAVYAWVARVWAARGPALAEWEPVGELPQDLGPLLAEIGATHLEQHAQNAAAHATGVGSYDLTIRDITYPSVPTSDYRVWALAQLRERFDEMRAADAGRAETLLREHGCWEPLWRADHLAPRHDPDRRAPFSGATRMVRDGGLLMRR